jgi:starch synthase
MRILHVASEAVPVCKTGGLADVVSGLARAQAEAGEDVTILLPAYRGTLARTGVRDRVDIADPLGLGHPMTVWTTPKHEGRATIALLQCDPLFDRPGGPYQDEAGADFADNHVRFAALSRAASIVALGSRVGHEPIDVVHAHDWPAALTTAYLSWWGNGRPATVFTIHNLHFTGRFDPAVLPAIAAPPSAWSPEDLEFYGQVSFLKAGLVHGDRVTTVSPSYADEIRTPDGGIGFDGLLRWRGAAVSGVLNGIDLEAWNPATDPAITHHYDVDRLAAKAACRASLQAELGLRAQHDAPVLGLVSRLTWQKGIDLWLGAMPRALANGAQLVVLGSGEPGLEAAASALASAYPGEVAVRHGYDDPLSRRIFAGADLFGVPSRFEPCGLTQMYAMRYGTPPVVRRTGGLADTVLDADARPDGNGFVFEAPTVEACSEAIDRAIAAYRDRERFVALVRRGMAERHDWGKGAASYAAVYRDAIAQLGPRP